MVQFAAELGLRQNTISQYESGKVVPSAIVLLNLFRLATTPSQRSAIRELLGDGAAILDKEDRLESAVSKLKTELDSAASALRLSGPAYQRFTELAVLTIEDPDGIPLWACELLQMWLDVKGDVKLRQLFDDVVHLASMKIRNAAGQRSQM
jgi:transcriptional regulator with XRE-family HTH domain